MLKAKKMSNIRSLRGSQEGMAAFVVVGILMTVATLIVVGFAVVSRREQRQSLDQQLSAQARYAAEAAINQKIAEYREDPTAFSGESSDCTDQGQTFSGATEIQTTCVRYSVTPGPLEFDEVSTEDSLVTYLDADGKDVDRIVITWQLPKSNVTGGNCVASGYNSLPPNLGANDIGMIRFDLTSLDETSFSRDSLKWGTLSGLLVPKTAPNTATYAWVPNSSWTSASTPPQGPVTYGACSNPAAAIPGAGESYKAQATINVPEDGRSYLLRMRSVYKTNRVKVVGYDDAGDIIEFSGAQVAFEATARVNDVVQRIQVRIPAGSPPANVLPDEALNVSSGICKLLQTEPASTSDGC